MSGGNIHAFARRGDLRSMRQQVEEFAADINEADVHKMTSLHYASKRGHTSLVTYLIERKADLELRNGTGLLGAIGQHVRAGSHTHILHPYAHHSNAHPGTPQRETQTQHSLSNCC